MIVLDKIIWHCHVKYTITMLHTDLNTGSRPRFCSKGLPYTYVHMYIYVSRPYKSELVKNIIIIKLNNEIQ